MNKKKEFGSCITITFCNIAENHVGMQKLGKEVDEGFSIKELNKAKKLFVNDGVKAKNIILNDYLEDEDKEIEKASVLIIKKGVNLLLGDEGNDDDLFKEHSKLDVDKKYYDIRRKRVLNKNARWNLCFGDENQKEDYENKKGKIVAFDELKFTNIIREGLSKYLGDKAKNMVAEGNYYYNKKCGIGFHGDKERELVIGVRIGDRIPFHYQWYRDGERIGKRIKVVLNHGDMYVMSAKAVGKDWRKKGVSLRHAAGNEKYLK